MIEEMTEEQPDKRAKSEGHHFDEKSELKRFLEEER